MTICDICGMEVVDVHDCSSCDAKFCDECGDVKHKLCYDCLGWDDAGEEESWEGTSEYWDYEDRYEDWEDEPN